MKAGPACAVLALAAALGACRSADPDAPRGFVFHVPLAETFDLARAAVLGDTQQIERLRGVRLLMLGEHHTEPASHRAELDLLRRLHGAGRAVTVALEMFPPAADEALEAWRQGTLSEEQFLERADWYRNWGFPWAYYRELFLWCRDNRIPLHGVNADAATRTAARLDKLDGLPPDVREDAGDLHEVVEPHRDLLGEELRLAGHSGDLSPGSDRFRSFLRVQTLWDRLMGRRAARLARQQAPGGIVVLLIGSGHLAYKLGANLQAERSADLSVLSQWDDQVEPGDLDAQGRARVPVGIADWARVYQRDPDAPRYPSLGGVKLERAEGGVRVDLVSPFAEPWLAAVHAGDLIVALNGEAVASPTALRLAVERLPPGKPAEFAVQRGGTRVPLALVPSANAGP